MATIFLKICIKKFQQNLPSKNKQKSHSSFLLKYKFIFFIILPLSTILPSDVLILLINRNDKINT